MPEEFEPTITVGENSYIDIEGADEYFAGRLHAEWWTGADDSTKEAALKQATRTIDRLLLKGHKADEDQKLAFPRYPDEEIPETVKEACCEEALALLERGNSQRRKLQQEGVQSFSLGNMSETYTAGAGKGLLSQEAKELLGLWMLGAVNIT
jgi:hypothetical protein